MHKTKLVVVDRCSNYCNGILLPFDSDVGLEAQMKSILPMTRCLRFSTFRNVIHHGACQSDSAFEESFGRNSCSNSFIDGSQEPCCTTWKTELRQQGLFAHIALKPLNPISTFKPIALDCINLILTLDKLKIYHPFG